MRNSLLKLSLITGSALLLAACDRPADDVATKGAAASAIAVAGGTDDVCDRDGAVGGETIGGEGVGRGAEGTCGSGIGEAG